MFLKKENLKNHLNKKIILGLSWKYIYLLLILLGIGGLLVLEFVYKKDSRFEAIKIFISITSVIMTFIVFLRGFEVFEETQKGNAKDNVNRNFYSMLSLFNEKQANLYSKEIYYSGSENKYTVIEAINNEIQEQDKYQSINGIDKINMIIIDTYRTVSQPYLSNVREIVKYLTTSRNNGIISYGEYMMYTSILSGQITTDEFKLICYYSLYDVRGLGLGKLLLNSGISGKERTYQGELPSTLYDIFSIYFGTKGSIKEDNKSKKSIENFIEDNITKSTPLAFILNMYTEYSNDEIIN